MIHKLFIIISILLVTVQGVSKTRLYGYKATVDHIQRDFPEVIKYPEVFFKTGRQKNINMDPSNKIDIQSVWMDDQKKDVDVRVVMDYSRVKLGIDTDVLDKKDIELIPSLKDADESPSIGVLIQKAKVFDDGLYAAAEYATYFGLGKLPSKDIFLKQLLNLLKDDNSNGALKAKGLIAASLLLHHENIDVDKKSRRIANMYLDRFFEDPLISKPIGFYTWNEFLKGVFKGDRILQTPFSAKKNGPVPVLYRLLQSHTDIMRQYKSLLGFIYKMTNPPAVPSIVKYKRGKKNSKYALFPASKSFEIKYLKTGKVKNLNHFMDNFIAAIRSGKFSIKPTKDSGWYDYETWALEPLLMPDKMPEKDHVSYSDKFIKLLQSLFKSTLALTRETHIKQLEMLRPTSAARPPLFHKKFKIWVYPQIHVEPIPQYYLRRAYSYRFIRQHLLDYFGVKGLKMLHRLSPYGRVSIDLDTELMFMQRLMYGAYIVSCMDIGVKPVDFPGVSKTKALRTFNNWYNNFNKDPDLNRDIRMMVPLFGVSKKKTKVLAVLGFIKRTVHVTFKRYPVVLRVLDKNGHKFPDSDYEVKMADSNTYTFYYPLSVELNVYNILNRKEFRKLCDRYKTPDAIIAHLR